jgi:hypothetical protein
LHFETSNIRPQQHATINIISGEEQHVDIDDIGS